MKKLLTLFLFCPLLSTAQGIVPFGGTTGNDTAKTVNSLRTNKVLALPWYVGEDTNVIGLAPGSINAIAISKATIQSWADQNGYLIPADTINKWIGIGWLSSLIKYPDTLSRLITTKTYVDSADFVVLADYAALISYSGLAQKAFLPDTNIGGFFTKTSASLTNDTGVVVPGAGGAHWVRAIQGQSILPRWYQVKGDSSTDDWCHMQAAINAGSRYKMPVYVKTGNYLMSQRVTVPTGVSVYCDQLARFSATASGQTVVYMGLNAKWDGGTFMLGTNGVAGFEFDGALRFTNGAVNHIVSNTRVQGGNVKGQKGYWLHGSGNNNDVQSVILNNCKVTSCPQGFVLESSNNSKIYNNIINGWVGGADTAIIFNNVTSSTSGGASYNKMTITVLPNTSAVSGTKMVYCNGASNDIKIENYNWISLISSWVDKKAVTFSSASENNTIDLRGSEAKYRHVNNYGSNNQILSLSYNNVNIMEYRDMTYGNGGPYRFWDTAFNQAILDIKNDFGEGTIYVPKDTFRTLHQIKVLSQISIIGESKTGTVFYNVATNGLVKASVFTLGLLQQAAYQIGMTEYRINQINPGNKITLTTAAQAANISIGSPWLVRKGFFPTPSTDTTVGSTASEWAVIHHVDSTSAITGDVFFREGFEDTIRAGAGVVMQVTNLNNALFKGDSCYIVEDVTLSNFTMMSDSSSPFIADAVLNGRFSNLVFGKGLYGGGGNGKNNCIYENCTFYYRNRAWESAECCWRNTIKDCNFYQTSYETRGAEKQMVLRIYEKVRNCNIFSKNIESSALRVLTNDDVDGLYIEGYFTGPLVTMAGNSNIIRNVTVKNLRNTGKSISNGTYQDADTSVTDIPVYYNTIANSTFIGNMDSTASSFNIDVKGDYNSFVGNRFFNNATNRKFNFGGVGDVFSMCYYDHPATPVITETTPGRTFISGIQGTSFTYPFSMVVDSPQHTLAVTPVWTPSGGAPSGTVTNTYSWKMDEQGVVTLFIRLNYTGAGASLTQVNIPLPADCPSPLIPTGYTNADNIISYQVGGMQVNKNNLVTSAKVCALKVNSGATGTEIVIIQTAGNYTSMWTTVRYPTR